MSRRPGRRFRIEAAISALSAVSLVATVIDPEWIEFVFGVDPDGGSGALEWGLSPGLAALALLSAARAGGDWRRAGPVSGKCPERLIRSQYRAIDSMI